MSEETGHDGAEEHQHDHGGHGITGTRTIKGSGGALRYVRWLPQMWRSAINDAVVDLVDPQPGELWSTSARGWVLVRSARPRTVPM